MRATVTNIQPSFLFCKPDRAGSDVFVHSSAMVEGTDFSKITVGTRLMLGEIVPAIAGGKLPRATNVSVIDQG